MTILPFNFLPITSFESFDGKRASPPLGRSSNGAAIDREVPLRIGST